MLCDLCHKNEATIHIQEIVEGHKKTLNICNDCAAKKQHSGVLDIGTFNLAEILYNIEKLTHTEGLGESDGSAGETAPAASPAHTPSPGPTCPVCGWDAAKIRKFGGRLGCPECYKVFREVVEPALTNMHRGVSHVGKLPHVGHDGEDGELIELTNRLAAAGSELNNLIRSEQYELAAVKRDEINAIRARMTAHSRIGETHETDHSETPEA